MKNVFKNKKTYTKTNKFFSIYAVSNKSVYWNLLNIYGLGSFSAILVLKNCGIQSKNLWLNITDSQLNGLIFWINSNFQKDSFGSSFIKESRRKFFELKNSKTRRSFRLKKGLPVRGQRTRTNANNSRKLRK